jgi:hypothetical protein
MIWTILGKLFTTALGQVTKDLTNAYQSKINAQTEQERIAAEERIATLEARKTTILAAQSDPYERWIRIGWSVPFILYNCKLVVWDKMLGLGTTDPLSPELYSVMMICLGGYFFTSGIKGLFK